MEKTQRFTAIIERDEDKQVAVYPERCAKRSGRPFRAHRLDCDAWDPSAPA